MLRTSETAQANRENTQAAFASGFIGQECSKLQRIKPARVVVENFFLDRIADEIVGAKNVDGVDFARSVRVAIVGTDDDIVFAGVAQDVIEVVVGFGGDVDIKFFERQLGKSFSAAAPYRFFDHPG